MPKISSRVAMKPELLDELAIALPLDDPLIRAAGERVGSGGADQHPVTSGDLADHLAQGSQLPGALGHASAG